MCLDRIQSFTPEYKIKGYVEINISCRSNLNLNSQLSSPDTLMKNRKERGKICVSIRCVFIRSGPSHWQSNQCLAIRLNVEWGVWVGTEGKEISIKQGTAESKPKELRRQYPDSGSLTKQCALNAKLLQPPPPTPAPIPTVNGCLIQWKRGSHCSG